MMTVTKRLRNMVPRPLRRSVAITTIAVAAGVLSMSGSGVRAHQMVYFDGAGDAPHISLIGDSTLTAVRWYEDYGELEQFNFVLSAESCRRTIERSCTSREGYRPDNVIAAMQSLEGELGEVLVVMSGYNDPVWTIDEAIEAVVGEARDQGVDTVIWLSLRTSEDVDYTDPLRQSGADTFDEYNEQLMEAAASSGGSLQVADWATHSDGASEWFERDGVHLSPEGVDGLTAFVADTVQRVFAGEDVTPAVVPWSVVAPGAGGETVAAVQRALIGAGVELVGGADGVYGDGTMAAVAGYQRSNDLEVTGTVDLATARALGVYPDPIEEIAAATPPVPTAPQPSPSTMAVEVGETTDGDDDDGVSRLVLVTVAVVLTLAGAVAGRRRYVVAQRAARRRARIHPAASPERSVADLRRAGEFPAAKRAHDRQLEESPVGEHAP